MEIIIKHYNNEYSVKTSHDEVDLPQILVLFGGLLRSAGFVFDGDVDIINDSED